MHLHAVIISLLSLFSVIESKIAGQACVCPNGRPGVCTRLRECPVLYQLALQSRQSSRTIALFRTFMCGFEGKYPVLCCPQYADSTTSNALTATEGVTPQAFVQRATTRAAPTTTQSALAGQSFENHPNHALLPDDCGEDFSRDVIAGGVAAKIGDYPWLVNLKYVKFNGRRPTLCGGSLISSRYVLTAAHCITPLRNKQLFAVRLGEHDLSQDKDCVSTRAGEFCADPVVTLDIEQATVHPGYRGSSATPKYDIALVRLNQTVQFTNFIRPICLPSGSLLRDNFVGNLQTAAGWGTNEYGTPSNIKMVVTLPVVTDEECADRYKVRTQIDAMQFCAGGEIGKDTCMGDSGGPLMMFHEKWYVTGIVSFGPSPCGTSTMPGVYTRVSSYVQWILDTIRP